MASDDAYAALCEGTGPGKGWYCAYFVENSRLTLSANANAYANANANINASANAKANASASEQAQKPTGVYRTSSNPASAISKWVPNVWHGTN